MTSIDDIGAGADFAGIHALSSRDAGYAVAAKCLQVQADAEALDATLRTSDGVRLAKDAWSWYTGALGEIEVGRMLAELGPEWFVRHSVPIGADTKDIDHLVIGPGGVFTINTKHHQDASIWVGDHVLRINNANTHYLNIAQRDEVDVARRLQKKVTFSFPVIPVLAVLNARPVVDRRAPENRRVVVLDARGLVAWLRSQPRRLDEGSLGLIKLAAEEPGTWHTDPSAADTLRVMQRFERLAAQVGTPPAPRSKQTVPPRTIRPAARRRPSTRPVARTPSRPRAKQKSSSQDLVKLWFAIGAIIVAIFMFRAYANQPCTTALSCLVPPLYLGLKPLLIIGGVIAVAFGIAGTMLWAVRGTRR